MMMIIYGTLWSVVNFLSTHSDKKSCNTSTTLQNSNARFVSDSWASCSVIRRRKTIITSKSRLSSSGVIRLASLCTIFTSPRPKAIFTTDSMGPSAFTSRQRTPEGSALWSFKLIQSHRNWYQLIAHMGRPINLPLQRYAFYSLRDKRLIGRKSAFSPFYAPQSCLKL